MTKPNLDKVPAFYQNYIRMLKSDTAKDALNEDFKKLIESFETLSDDQLNFRYAPDKWTIKQVLQHLIDTERIMSYRALRFSRNDRNELPGFDQDLYANSQGLSQRTKQSMIDEFTLVRECSRALYKGFTPTEIKREGIANGYVMSVNSLAFIIAGHSLHHLEVLNKHYFNASDYPK